MALFLLRDDDANATTDPARLERAYAPLLDAGHAMTFSVIPDVALDTLAPDGAPERFLPEDLAGPPVTVGLRRSSPLAAWLRARADQCSVAQHGLDHRRVREGTEFGALSHREASDRMRAGHDILTIALGHAPLGFVAPWDALSRGAVVAATELFPVISTSWLDRDKLPPRWWPAHAAERLQRREMLQLGSSLVLRHRGGLIGPATAPDDVPAILEKLSLHAEVAVVVLHHWMFWESSEPHPVIRALARALAGHRTAGLPGLAGRLSQAGLPAVPERDAAGGLS